MSAQNILRLALLGALFALMGCDAESEATADYAPNTPSTPGATGVSQGGSQDFGLFRQILEAGMIPAPSTLDALGFFAEHKLDFPAADCGDDICLHGLVGIQANMISGTDCTVVQIGLNSPLRPDPDMRRPLDIILAIDISGSMRGRPMDAVLRGLHRMVGQLGEDDRVSIIAYSDTAHTLLVDEGEGVAIDEAIDELIPGGATNIYDGLYTAFQVAEMLRGADRERRVILLSDGQATAGIESADRMKSLAAGYARRGIGLTTIGVGEDFDVTVMRSLSEVGAGNFYFLEDLAAVEEVFIEELKTFLTPVALDVKIDVRAGASYRVGDAYGTNGWTGGLSGGLIEIPSLFLAGRRSADAPIEGGRRGGGGGIIVELLPRRRATQEPTHVGTLTMTWTDPTSGEQMTQRTRMESPNAPGEYPAGGYWTDDTVQKGFVMLNLLVAFQMAADLSYDADNGAAIGVLRAVRGEVQSWLRDHGDPDIEDDLRYLDMFIANLETQGVQTPISQPPEPWPFD